MKIIKPDMRLFFFFIGITFVILMSYAFVTTSTLFRLSQTVPDIGPTGTMSPRKNWVKKNENVMVGIPLFNNENLEEFASLFLKDYPEIWNKNIHVFGNRSVEYTQKLLYKRYGRGIYFHRLEGISDLVGIIRHILKYFIKYSTCDSLLILDSDMIFSEGSFKFISDNINQVDILSLFRGKSKCVSEREGICVKDTGIYQINGAIISKKLAEIIINKPIALILYRSKVMVHMPIIHGLEPLNSRAVTLRDEFEVNKCISHSKAHRPTAYQHDFPCWVWTEVDSFIHGCNGPDISYDKDIKNIESVYNAYWSKNVVSYSFYGDSHRYTDGALANSELMSSVYPDWKMWVYHDNTVPESILNVLCQRGVRLIDMTGKSVTNQMSWRFLVASEPVKRYIIRDIDSRLSLREKDAVDEWIASGKKFHIMRDHPAHSNFAISGGMWGGTYDAFPEMASQLHSRILSNAYLEDMNFLNNLVWAKASMSMMQHDGFPNGKFGEVHPFPTKRIGLEHVGSVYIDGKMREIDLDPLKRAIERKAIAESA